MDPLFLTLALEGGRSSKLHTTVVLPYRTGSLKPRWMDPRAVNDWFETFLVAMKKVQITGKHDVIS
jgi:hypothetical protein